MALASKTFDGVIMSGLWCAPVEELGPVWAKWKGPQQGLPSLSNVGRVRVDAAGPPKTA